MDSPVLLGVDVGGTKVALALSEPDGRMLADTRFVTSDEHGPDFIIQRIVSETERLVESLGRISIGVVGIACSGPVSCDTGGVHAPPNLPGWYEVPLASRLSAALGAPAWLDNDANLAALGEHRHGAGQGITDMVYVTVSAGIGAGLIFDNRLLHGVRDAAGELGHQTILPGGPRCGCGNDGCLEAVASGLAIARHARAAALSNKGAASALLARVDNDVTALTAKHVAEAAREGDALARRVWDQAMEYLGIGIGNAITVLSPQRVVIGGGVAAAGDLLFEPVRKIVQRRVRLVPAHSIDIVPAALGESSALRGAIALAQDHFDALRN